jgi:hypothetical protein
VDRGKRRAGAATPRPSSKLCAVGAYLIVKYQDAVRTFLAASVATISTVFFPLAILGEL